MTNMAKIGGIACLAATRNDEWLTFTCDDCGSTLTVSDRTGEVSSERSSLAKAFLEPWSITRRKQRCPGCTVVARAKGWVA